MEEPCVRLSRLREAKLGTSANVTGQAAVHQNIEALSILDGNQHPKFGSVRWLEGDQG